MTRIFIGLFTVYFRIYTVLTVSNNRSIFLYYFLMKTADYQHHHGTINTHLRSKFDQSNHMTHKKLSLMNQLWLVIIKKLWFYYSKILFSCDFESAANAIDSLNSIGLLNEGTATAAVHCEAISASTALNNFSVPTVVTHDETRDKILTSSPLASLTILRFWQRQYKFKHGTNIDRHPFKQSVWPAFAAVWPEIEMQFFYYSGLGI